MDILKRAMVEALKSTYGRVARACEIAGIARSTHYLWMSNDEEYKAAVEDVNEAAIDHVESKLFEKIEQLTIAEFNYKVILYSCRLFNFLI